MTQVHFKTEIRVDIIICICGYKDGKEKEGKRRNFIDGQSSDDSHENQQQI